MEQVNHTTGRKKHKHISGKDRYTIEQMLKAGHSEPGVAVAIGCTRRTVTARLRSITVANTGIGKSTWSLAARAAKGRCLRSPNAKHGKKLSLDCQTKRKGRLSGP